MEVPDGSANRRAADHDIAAPEGYPDDRPVSQPQVAWELGDHIRSTRNRAAEADSAGGYRPHRIAVTCSVLDTTISRAPSTRRLTKRIDDLC